MLWLYNDIRVKGYDCLIGVIIDLKKFRGFDISIHEEDIFGMLCSYLIELIELSFGAVKVIIDCYPYNTSHGNSSVEDIQIIY